MEELDELRDRVLALPDGCGRSDLIATMDHITEGVRWYVARDPCDGVPYGIGMGLAQALASVRRQVDWLEDTQGVA